MILYILIIDKEDNSMSELFLYQKGRFSDGNRSQERSLER